VTARVITYDYRSDISGWRMYTHISQSKYVLLNEVLSEVFIW